MEFLYEDSLVHEAVPIDTRLHVTFPLVEVDIMTELLACRSEQGRSRHSLGQD